jgi:hypothetical protein
VYLPYTWRGTAQDSALMYPAGTAYGRRGGKGSRPAATAGRPGAGTSRVYGRYTRRRRGRGDTGCRPGLAVCAGRSLRGGGRSHRADAGVAGCILSGGGSEPVGAGLVGDHLRDPEADQLVQGVGDRPGRPGEYLADLVRAEGRLRELAQVLLNQVAQRPGPGRGGAAAAGGGLQYPPPAGGLLPGGVQGGQRGGQVPGREGLPGLVGRLGDGQDVPGGIGDDRRVRPSCGAGVRFPAFGGAAGGGGLANVGRAADRRRGLGGAVRAGGVGGRGLVGRGCRGGGRPGVGDAGPAALDPGRGAVLLAGEQGLPGGGDAEPGAGGDDRDGAPAGSADSAARTAAAGLSAAAGATGAGAGSVAVSAALRATCGAGAVVLVRAMMVTPFCSPALFRFPFCLRRCFLDDNCSGSGVKSSGSAAIPDA